ncbi:copper transport protein ATX1-like [Bidens hawaiensis]|uniref:copper transport protein ATX1-like n=1 Tax=Bidens hawaiensis TaxID=980011 RepID=UPI00404A381E
MSQTVVLKVAMSCGGCAGAVKRVLSTMEGVETFDIDLEQKKVTVKGNIEPNAVLQTVSKTGKKAEFWPSSAAKEAIDHVVASTGEAKDDVDHMVAPTSEAKEVEPVVAPSGVAEKPVESVV